MSELTKAQIEALNDIAQTLDTPAPRALQLELEQLGLIEVCEWSPSWDESDRNIGWQLTQAGIAALESAK